MSTLATLLLGLAGIGIAYLALSAVLLLRFPKARAAALPSAGHPAVTILKPLHGTEPGLAENLASFVAQDYLGDLRVVFGVQNAADPAVAVVRRLQAAHPHRDLVLVVDATLHGENRKVSNLINMAREIRGEVVVLADSDMRAMPDYLARIVAELSLPGIGAVSCPYHALPIANGWSELSGLAIDTHFLPGVVTGASLRLAQPCMGSTIALRRETLERAGGFGPLADALADDYELGAAVRRLGLAVSLTTFSLGHVCPETSLSAVLHQELRWARTIRQVAPGGHLGSLITHPFAWAILALALEPGLLAATVALAAIGGRIAVCLAAEQAFGLKAHRYSLAPARDVLSAAIFVASFTGRRVSWRGQRFHVARTGALLTRPGSP